MADEQPMSFSAQSQGDNSLETANNAQNVVPAAPEATKTKRITAKAKEALIKYFNESKWPRNKKMTKANGDAGIDKIINEFGLERKQASYQLSKWKKATYEKAQVEILIDSTDAIKEAIEESMSETPEDFVVNFLDVMIDAGEIEGSVDTTNLIQSLSTQPDLNIKRIALRHIKNNRNHTCFKSLVSYLNDLIQAMAEELPALASKVSVSEIKFSSRKEAAKKRRIEQWIGVYNDMPGDKKLSPMMFAYFGMFVAECLFFVWVHSTIDNELPPVEIPLQNLVAKYSMPVIYYVAGWTLQRASLALTVPKSKRQKFYDFYPLHKRHVEYAKENKLPYSMVQLRQKKKLIYVTKDYFEFICLIESIYVKNLSMKMMMAYNSGDLVKVIDGAIMKSETVLKRFFALFEDEEDDDEISEARDTLRFILDRYIRMRGCWFVKALRSNRGETLGEKKLAAAPTNMKVAHAATQSKAIAEALRNATGGAQTSAKEQELWNQAAEAVVEFENNEDDDDGAAVGVVHDGMDDNGEAF
eukprot:scaffold5653_cov95-Skeletonema_dohrnii-CCMP3373.AAC.6